VRTEGTGLTQGLHDAGGIKTFVIDFVSGFR
jgi:hypothetical protein